jgi:hypothetical protein
MILRSFTFYLLTLSAFLSSSGFAYEMDDQVGYVNPRKSQFQSERFQFNATSDRLRKFSLVLKDLGVPPERSPNFSGFPLSQEVTRPDFEANLDILDPDAGLRRYLSLDDQGVSLFQDFFSHLLPEGFLEYGVDFLKSAPSTNTEALLAKLSQISKQVKNPAETQPLAGLKILIDPGHMGTPDWDTETGKYVKIQNQKVSEGQLNLWTALLTANAFESLGATVYLTRTEDGAVSPLDPSTFDSSPFFNQYFYNSLDSWMSHYLSLPDSSILTAVRNAPEAKKAYSTNQRTQFFITGADLEARSRLIDQVQPDIVIDIHYDANQSDQLQNQDNSIEAFVPGGFRKEETGSRYVRSLMFNHLLETRRFNASVDLAADMIQGMSRSLNLKLQNTPEFLTSIRVRDGVYARNLYISRRNTTSLMVYLECLHYDHVSEFGRLAKTDLVGNYHGKTFNYPSRLQTVVDGIRAGFLHHFQK